MSTMRSFRAFHLVGAAGLALSWASPSIGADAPANPSGVEVIDTAREQAPNGVWFDITKAYVNGVGVTTYTGDGLSLTDAEYRAWVRALPVSKVDSALGAAVEKAAPADLIPVAVHLKRSPAEQIRREVEQRHRARMDALDARREAYYAQEMALPIIDDALRGRVLADQRRAIARDHEALTDEMRAEVRGLLLPRISDSQKMLLATIERLGGKVRGTMGLVNGAEALLPASAVGALAADPTVARIVLSTGGEPELATQAVSLGLTTGFWANGIDGTTWDAGQLDSGIQEDHPTFAVTFLNGPGMGSTDSDGHGTAVASILTGSDATNRGMAFGADRHLNTTWNNVQSSVDWMFLTASDDAEVVNGSFGIPADAPTVADYTATEQYLDYMMRTQSFIYTKSCGNLGPGAETITQPVGIYNGIAVANMNDQNSTTRTDDVITNSSSRGPTINGRKKPDMCAPGNATTAANNGWTGVGADWISFGGTSSASPHVGGGVLLLTDARGSDSPLPIKAILINTADAWDDADTLASTTDDGAVNGTEWNATYGWGYLDLGAAYTNRFNAISSNVAGSPAYRLYKGSMPANGKATLVWNRFVDSTPTAQPLTDLDLYVYNESTGATVDSSTDTNDNVEQVASSSAIEAVLKVDAWSSVDPDIGANEPFALAHTGGFTTVSLPVLTSFATPSQPVSPGEPFTLRVFVSNNSADLNAHNCTLTMNAAPAGWAISSTGVTNLGTLQSSGQTVVTEYIVTPPCNLAGTSGGFTWTLGHTSYGEAWSAADGQTITVSPIAAIAAGTTISDAAPITYSFAVAAGDYHAVGAFAFPAINNISVFGDDAACITSPWQTSDFFDDRTDFVIVNGNALGASTQYAHIKDVDGLVPTVSIRHDNGFDFGTTHAFALAAADPIYVLERTLNAGVTYVVKADITSGSSDIAVFGYRPDSTFEERNSADFSRDLAGAGGDERFNVLAPIAGTYGFVVANDNKQAANITFTVVCIADFNANGALTIDDLFLFINAYFLGSLDADMNASNSVTIDDLFLYFNYYFLGC